MCLSVKALYLLFAKWTALQQRLGRESQCLRITHGFTRVAVRRTRHSHQLVSANGLHVERDFDAVADQYTACLQGYIPVQPKVFAIDFHACAKAFDSLSPRILARPLELGLQGNFARGVAKL